MNMIFKTDQIKFKKADSNHEYVRMFITPNYVYTYGYMSKFELDNHWRETVPVVSMTAEEASLLAASYKLTKSLHEALLHASEIKFRRAISDYE